jgi:2'-5' RNA ligase
MLRLFVAIRPPEPVRAQLLAAMGGVGGARWLSDDQLHLTLRFIGEVDRHLAEDVHAALGALHHPRFEIALAGIGSFERRGEPATLWAAVAPREDLQRLHGKIDQALVRAGVAPDRRAYVPHITLARIPRGAGPVGPFLQGAGPLAGPPFAVEDFCLFESRLTPDGPVYSIVERYRLG